MNTEILKRLSDEKLKELKDAIDNEMKSRKDFSIRVGRTGYFIDSDGTKRYVRVERINPKSITVKPISGAKGGWRLSPSLLVMDGVSISGAGPTLKLKTPTTSPAETYNVEAW